MQIRRLFDRQHERLKLSWASGKAGGARVISVAASAENEPDDGAGRSTQSGRARRRKAGVRVDKALVGHLNLIHPNQVQILGLSEIRYLDNLRSISRRDSLAQLIEQAPSCIIIGDDQPIPEPLRELCQQAAVPLLVSPLSSNRLTDSLYHFLQTHFAAVITLHGVYLEVATIGVLITGVAGIGKSELALELITRGHRLIADDAPQFSRLAPDTINGTCPEALQDFLEVRGIGIVNVRALFGDGAIKQNKYLRLIIRLEPATEANMADQNRLEGSYQTLEIFEVEIPEITLVVAPGRNLAVLVECAARNHILMVGGYKAAGDFAARQQQLIDSGRSE